MLKTKSVQVSWMPTNKKYYETLGYTFTKYRDKFEVKIDDLSENSDILVEVQCDYCGKIFPRKYHNHVVCTKRDVLNKDACQDCLQIKAKESTLVKFNVSSMAKLDSTKEKVKETNRKLFGVDYYTQTNEYKERVKNTSLNNYGVEHHLKSKDVILKRENTCLQKYGFKNVSQSSDIQKTRKKTILDRYGVEHYSQTNDFKQKFVKTCLQNHGVEYPSQSEEIRQKIVESYYKNGTCPTSKQQLSIYNALLSNNYNVILNYPFFGFNYDIALFIDTLKIDIEYDGGYWHVNRQEKDKKRDEFSIFNGWKVLRIKSNTKLPQYIDLINAINTLIKSDINYTEIILDDYELKVKNIS